MKLIPILIAFALMGCPSVGVSPERLDAMDAVDFDVFLIHAERRTTLLAQAVLAEGDATPEDLVQVAEVLEAPEVALRGLLPTLGLEGYQALAAELALERLDERLGYVAEGILSERSRAALAVVAGALRRVAQ